MKNEKGISLIALVIIILILIVLAIVTLYLVIGPDGVFESQQIAKQTNEEIDAENVLLEALAELNATYNEKETETTESADEELEEETESTDEVDEELEEETRSTDEVDEELEEEIETTLQTRLDGLTVEFLNELNSDYTYQLEDSIDTTGKIVTMTKGEYTFKALVTESLSIYEFKRISGGTDTETFESN